MSVITLKMNIPRKRSGSNSKKTKEKYEVLFKNEESDEVNKNLLIEIIGTKIQLENFEIEVMKIVDIEKSTVVRKNLNLLIRECINSLDSGEIWKIIRKLPAGLKVSDFSFKATQKRLLAA